MGRHVSGRIALNISDDFDWSILRIICADCVTVARDVATLRYWRGSDSFVMMHCECGLRVMSVGPGFYVVDGPAPHKVLTSTHFEPVPVETLQKHRDREEADMLASAARLERFDAVLAAVRP